MKPFLAGCLFLSSCVGTYIRTPAFTLARVSLLSNQQIPGVAIRSNGSAVLTGYQSKPDTATVEAFAKGIVRSVVP